MEVEQCLRALFATFGTEATPDLIRGYCFGVSNLEPSALKVGVSRAIRECERLPRPAELRELAGVPSPESRALDAWGDVLPRVSGLGYRRHVDFEDKLINAAIRNMTGTWSAFCERCNTTDIQWVKKEFMTAYVTYARAGVGMKACRPLAGEREGDWQPDGSFGPPIPNLVECSAERRKLPMVKPDAVPLGNLLELPKVRIKNVS